MFGVAGKFYFYIFKPAHTQPQNPHGAFMLHFHAFVFGRRAEEVKNKKCQLKGLYFDIFSVSNLLQCKQVKKSHGEPVKYTAAI